MNTFEHQTLGKKKVLIEMPFEMAEALREHSLFEQTSMSAVVRRLLAEHLGEAIDNTRAAIERAGEWRRAFVDE